MVRGVYLAIGCLALAACGDGGAEGNQAGATGNAAGGPRPAAPSGAKAGQSLLDSLTGSGEHATLANAVKAAGLTETLSGAQPYTLFAPTEEAFRKLPGGAMNDLLAPESKGRLTALLASHIVPGTVTAEDLGKAIERGKGKAELATVGGTNLRFARADDAILLTDANGGQARVVAAEKAASNGVIHSLDAVLMPR
jgi:uncharacterized surface protein with fasciclin (FAS1) repeats